MSLSRIARMVETDPILRPYYQDARVFADYLDRTARCSFDLSGMNTQTWEDVRENIDYIHRWTVVYRKAYMAKLYQLDDWWRENKTPITMLTLTTYQGAPTERHSGDYSRSVVGGDGLTIPQAFETLKASWKCLSMVIRKDLRGVNFVWVVEPHESGYPHQHVAIFEDLTMGMQNKIRDLWSRKYRAGSHARGVDFSTRKPGETIESLRNYLMKYMAKGFVTTGSKYDTQVWTPQELVFNAVAWKNKYRFFGASHELCRAMRYDKTQDERILWYLTELLDQDGEKHEVWQKPQGDPVPYGGDI